MFFIFKRDSKKRNTLLKISSRHILFVCLFVFTLSGCTDDTDSNKLPLKDESNSSYQFNPGVYVEIPSLKGYTEKPFYVAKYEMKKDEKTGKAVSTAKGLPWVNITRDEAVAECKKLGKNYDLITNAEWQTIARDIELVNKNWHWHHARNIRIPDIDTYTCNRKEWTGKFDRKMKPIIRTIVQNGFECAMLGLPKNRQPFGINIGHSDGSSPKLLMAGDDKNPCFETEETCTDLTWNRQKRTFLLSNKEVLWDFSGNAGEWVKDETTSNFIGRGTSMEIIKLSSLKTKGSLTLDKTALEGTGYKFFGSSRTGYIRGYNTPEAQKGYWGLGFIVKTNEGGSAILRGGFYNALHSRAGIFMTYTGVPSNTKSEVYGFRCVRHKNEN